MLCVWTVLHSEDSKERTSYLLFRNPWTAFNYPQSLAVRSLINLSFYTTRSIKNNDKVISIDIVPCQRKLSCVGRGNNLQTR